MPSTRSAAYLDQCTILLALPLMLGLVPTSTDGLTKSPWPKFHGGAGGDTLGVGSEEFGKDGTIYFGSQDKKAYALR